MPEPSARPRSAAATLACAAVLALLAGPRAARAATPAPAATAFAEAWPAGRPGILIRDDVERRVAELLARMTLEEKVGQMVQANIGSIDPEDLRKYHLGSILAGGDAAPSGNVRATPGEWLALTDRYARAAVADGGPRHAPIPLLFGIDAVHGHAHVVGATIFPHNVGLGAAHDPALIERIGAATAAEVAATGIDWAFAPTVAVVRDPRWGRSYESYSEDPALVARYSAAMVTGLQGAWGTAEFMAAGHTVSSVKHFMGDGGTTDGRDQFDNTAEPGEFVRVHGAGYPPAIGAGVLTVMASYSSWRGIKMHANRELLTDVLKGRLGFNGFVVGDWNAQEEVPGCRKTDCPVVIRAGIDMVMAPDSWRGIYRNTLREARSGAIPAARIDDAVRRILRVKILAGLFEHPIPSERPGAGRFAELGSAAHRALAREAVRKSLVLLKNDGGLLPLSPHGHVLVAGDAADDLGRQAGGWTIDWQGAHNRNADFPGATSIFVAVRTAMQAGGGTAELAVDGRYRHRPDAAIVVFGEEPYAEYQGDRETLEYSPGEKRDLELIGRLRAERIPVVVVFLSGRPMWVNRELNAANAFVAAWLPGSEGDGVADVLVRAADGSVRHDFTGRLPLTWPATAMPARLDANDRAEGALFARGYGLDYAHAAVAPRYAEAAAAPGDRHAANVLFTRGRVTAPWSIFINEPDAEVRLTTHEQLTPAGRLEVTLDPHGLRAAWTGGGRSALRIGGRATDLRARAAAGQVLRIQLRVEEAPAGTVHVGVRCGTPGGAEVPSVQLTARQWIDCRAPSEPTFDVTRELASATPGGAVELALPLACFEKRGADLSAVETPFVLATDSKLRVTVTDVRLAPGHGAAACPGE